MQERQIDYVRVGRVKPRKKNWKVRVWNTAVEVLESLGTVLTYIGIGCFLGIGFGGGMAIAAVLI